MGKLNQAHTLVVMTNGDVYYMTPATAKQLIDAIAVGKRPTFFRFIDAKSLLNILVATENISSIVEGDHHAQR